MTGVINIITPAVTSAPLFILGLEGGSNGYSRL